MVDARRIERDLERKAAALPRVRGPLRLAIAGRREVRHASAGTLAVTAVDVF